jgi:hypothetical protein
VRWMPFLGAEVTAWISRRPCRPGHVVARRAKPDDREASGKDAIPSRIMREVAPLSGISDFGPQYGPRIARNDMRRWWWGLSRRAGFRPPGAPTSLCSRRRAEGYVVAMSPAGASKQSPPWLAQGGRGASTRRLLRPTVRASRRDRETVVEIGPLRGISDFGPQYGAGSDMLRWIASKGRRRFDGAHGDGSYA